MKVPKISPGILVILLITAVFAYSQINGLSLIKLGVIPGFEGLHSGVEGVQVGGSVYLLGMPFPAGYTWDNADPKSVVLGADLDDWDSKGQTRVEVGDPREYADPWFQPKQIDYWLKNADGTFSHVKGEVVKYTVPVTVSARDVGGINPHVFTQEKFWVSLKALSWNRAVQEQSPVTGKDSTYGVAWEGPLQCVVEKYATRDNGAHYYLDPSIAGRTITLYTSPSQTGVIGGIDPTDPKMGMGETPSPDSRITQNAFFSVSLTDFGVTRNWLGFTCPVADYELVVYALRVGKYTYTNQNDTPWAIRPPDKNPSNQWWEGFTKAIGDFGANISNPWNLAVLGVFVLAAIFLYTSGPAIVGAVSKRIR